MGTFVRLVIVPYSVRVQGRIAEGAFILNYKCLRVVEVSCRPFTYKDVQKVAKTLQNTICAEITIRNRVLRETAVPTRL
jgi:hypothetical protein